ncbi:MAG: GAF domain-containing protein [Armatimonadetes bacterium]|nr:GAF domain-containing protein [Armatimonadota bacterium]MDE2206434.1 GAF domain-containing protein [Armatimonadota bacterium]
MGNGNENSAIVLETARRVALDILSSNTGVEALKDIAEAARTLSGARYAALGVARLDGEGLAEFVTVGLTPHQEAAIGARPRGLGVLGHLLSCRTPVRIDRLSQHERSFGVPAGHPQMESFLGVPIWAGDSVAGSLYLTDKRGGEGFTEDDEIAVQALGEYAAVAIYNLHSLARQRALVRGFISAQEEERRAVACDLHDGLTQFVMASHAHLQAFQRASAAGRSTQAELELEQGLRCLNQAVLESRRLVNGLRPLALTALGLAGALEQMLGEEKRAAGWPEARLEHNIGGRRFDAGVEATLYRVAQEALTNVRKHAGPASVVVELFAESAAEGCAEALKLTVRDSGIGFAFERLPVDYNRAGLPGMAERMRLLSGSLKIESAPGTGTLVTAHAPALPPDAGPAELAAQQNDVPGAENRIA